MIPHLCPLIEVLLCLAHPGHASYLQERFCRKFSFALIEGMIPRRDFGCQERESENDEQLQGRPFSTR